jgi:hypothetical protein
MAFVLSLVDPTKLVASSLLPEKSVSRRDSSKLFT